MMKKILLLAIALLLTACGPKTLNGSYENPPDTFVGHIRLDFKPNGTVTITNFGKTDPVADYQYKVDGDKIMIQNNLIPLTMFNDGSIDGNVFGVFKKK